MKNPLTIGRRNITTYFRLVSNVFKNLVGNFLPEASLTVDAPAITAMATYVIVLISIAKSVPLGIALCASCKKPESLHLCSEWVTLCAQNSFLQEDNIILQILYENFVTIWRLNKCYPSVKYQNQCLR